MEDNKEISLGGWLMQSAEINKLKRGTAVSLCTLVLITVCRKTKTSHVQERKKIPKPVHHESLCDGSTLGWVGWILIFSCHGRAQPGAWTQPMFIECLEGVSTWLVEARTSKLIQCSRMHTHLLGLRAHPQAMWDGLGFLFGLSIPAMFSLWVSLCLFLNSPLLVWLASLPLRVGLPEGKHHGQTVSLGPGTGLEPNAMLPNGACNKMGTLSCWISGERCGRSHSWVGSLVALRVRTPT